MQTAQEKLAEVEAENKLLVLGWGKGKCPVCEGQRYVGIPFVGPIICKNCDGSGLAWTKLEVGK